jgi:predicted ATPase
MKIREIGVAGYRSVRALRFPVGRLTVFVGPNGVGKTNLYRALQLIQAAAAGTLARELSSEGGVLSALWAGKRRSHQRARIRLLVELGDQAASLDEQTGGGREVKTAHSYEVEVGPPDPAAATLSWEPEIKQEKLTLLHGGRSLTLLERHGAAAHARDIDGKRASLNMQLLGSETALGALHDPERFPEVDIIRRIMGAWRFYHDLRTDRASPLRQPCLAVATPTLASDGSDLAAVFATVVHIRQDASALDQAIQDAFPGAGLVVPSPERMATFGLKLPEFPHRVFEAAELSDGMLRYLGLAGALLGYRLPTFVALNEPEASLHPDLMEPLARMIIHAAERTQIWVVTHSERLAAAFAAHGEVTPRQVIKRDGETWIEGLTLGGHFRDELEDED